jgi:ribosome recycling factor
MLKDVERVAQEKMQHSMEALKKELGTIRTGRATPALLDGVNVEYYGAPTPVTQVASVSIPESRSIVIQPWDPTIMGDIEKAILRANLGLTPTNDGKVIRISIPALTEERRKDLVKVARKYAEEGRVALRNVRRDVNEQVKKLEKDGKISQDEMRASHERVQKHTDDFTALVNSTIEKKEKEIMEI